MDIENVLNRILLFDYDNDENVSRFIQQIIPMINKQMKLIDELEDYVQILEYELNNVIQCQYTCCKYDDLKEELEKMNKREEEE